MVSTLLKMTPCLLLLCAVIGLVRSQRCGMGDEQITNILDVANNVEAADAVQATKMNFSWADMLTSAPNAINTLSLLVVVTNGRQVNLNVPPKKWKYLLTPESLHATMSQIAQYGYQALRKAHFNMHTIQQKTKEARGLLTKIGYYLDGSEIERKFLPETLNELNEIAPFCANLATEISDKFNNVTLLIEETILACTQKQDIDSTKLAEAKNEMQRVKMRLEKEQDRVRRMTKNVNEAKESMNRADKKLAEAIESDPAFWNYLGSTAVETFSTLSKTALVGVTCTMGGPAACAGIFSSSAMQFIPDISEGISGAIKGNTNNAGHRQFENNFVSNVACLSLYKRVLEGSKLSFKVLVDKLGTSASNLTEFNEKIVEFEDGKTMFNRGCSNSASAFCGGVKDQIERAIRILAEATQVQTSVGKTVLLLYATIDNKAKTVAERVKREANDWQAEAFKLGELASRAAGESNSLPPLTSTQVQQAHIDPSVGALMNDKYKAKMAAANEQFRASIKAFEVQQARMEESIDKETDLQAKLMSIDLTKTDLTDALDILKEAITQLSQLETNWKQLANFFEYIKILVKVEYVTKSEELLRNLNIVAESEKEKVVFSKDTLFKDAFSTTTLNYRIFRMSSLYVNVSTNYFLKPLEKMLRGIAEAVRADNAEIEKSLGTYNRHLNDVFKSLCPSPDDVTLQKQAVTAAVETRKKYDFSG